MRLHYLVVGICFVLILIGYKDGLSSVVPYIDKYLLAINLLAFSVFLLDKVMASFNFLRAPEKLMFIMAAIGGAGGGALSLGIFNHKTSKWSFKIKFSLASAISLAAIVFLLQQ